MILALMLLLLAASSAEAREISLHWIQPGPEAVDSYVLEVGTLSDMHGQEVPFATPVPDEQGEYRAKVVAPISARELYYRISAVGPGGRSEPSNELVSVCPTPFIPGLISVSATLHAAIFEQDDLRYDFDCNRVVNFQDVSFVLRKSRA